ESDGHLYEFSPDPKDKAYWTMLNRLVSDITRTLIELKYSLNSQPATELANAAGASATTVAVSATTVTPAPIAPNGAAAAKLVYLAETTSDLAKERELVRDELQQRSYTVLPEQKLPLEELKQTQEAVRANLARCVLSVHLVGTRYGSTPEDDARSVVRIQEDLACERGSSNPAFLRLLWMPPGLMTDSMPITDERQK